MGRRERPVDPEAGPVQRFAYELRQLRQQAGGLSYRQLAKRAHYSATALSEAAAGEQLPSLAVTLAYVQACGGDQEAWKARWQALAAQLASADDDIGGGPRGRRRPNRLVRMWGWRRFSPTMRIGSSVGIG
jgi:transcriptional regulator with XRE-family HTH domain